MIRPAQCVDKRFPYLAAALLALMAALQITSAAGDSQTWDEAFGIAEGYSYLKTGDVRLDVAHPIFAKVLNALPLLWVRPSLPLDDRSWLDSKPWEFSAKFLYANRVPAGKMLAAARGASIAFALAVGVVLAWWTRRTFGAGAALLALAFYSLDPNWLAHSRYTTSDPWVTGFIFLASIAWIEHVRKRGWHTLVLAGILLGCALGSKLSALSLPLVFALISVLYAFRWPRPGVFRMASDLAACLGVAALFLALVYAPEVKAAVVFWTTGEKQMPFVDIPLASYARPVSLLGRLLRAAGETFHLPAFAFLRSLSDTADHLQTGHQAYLLGEISDRGWWYYFPVAMLVKTPTAALLAFLIGAVLGISRLHRSLTVAARHEGPRSLKHAALAIPPAVFLLFSIAATRVNIGLRHVLPVYPFLWVLTAALLCRAAGGWWEKIRRPAIAALVALFAAESAATYPHYVAFFNWPSGGPVHGPRYLLDSNLDWGQDLSRAADWVRSRGNPPLCACYFGRAPLEYYGLAAEPLPVSKDSPEWKDLDCVALVSATPLYGLYVSPDAFARLRRREPTARIGYSIYAYDLRKSAAAAGEPAPPGVYDDFDSRVHVRNSWSRDRQFSSAAGGTLSYSNHPAARLTFVFRGSGICWVHTKALNRGRARVMIDGFSRGTLDLYSSNVQWQARACFGGLARGIHKFEIFNASPANSASSGAYIDADAFEVLR
jgi:hypothetical protein